MGRTGRQRREGELRAATIGGLGPTQPVALVDDPAAGRLLLVAGQVPAVSRVRVDRDRAVPEAVEAALRADQYEHYGSKDLWPDFVPVYLKGFRECVAVATERLGPVEVLRLRGGVGYNTSHVLLWAVWQAALPEPLLLVTREVDWRFVLRSAWLARWGEGVAEGAGRLIGNLRD